MGQAQVSSVVHNHLASQILGTTRASQSMPTPAQLQTQISMATLTQKPGRAMQTMSASAKTLVPLAVSKPMITPASGQASFGVAQPATVPVQAQTLLVGTQARYRCPLESRSLWLPRCRHPAELCKACLLQSTHRCLTEFCSPPQCQPKPRCP